MKKKILTSVIAVLIGVSAFPQKMVETHYYQTNPELGGDVVIKSSAKEVKDGKAFVSFEVEAPYAGEFFANFWMLPTRLNNGEYSKYDVSVNGNILNEKICPVSGDWQSISLANDARITLNKGTNVISVIGDIPDVPNVEHVKLSAKSSGAVISNVNYLNYKNDISKISTKNTALKKAATSYVLSDTAASGIEKIKDYGSQDNPAYSYQYSKQITIKYTFYKTLYFTKDEQIFIATNGIDNAGHILELFSVEDPESYSWNATSNSKCLASLNITIPQTGLYIVKVRSNRNAANGLCNVNVNGENYYDNVPIFSIGVRCEQGTDQVYNTFTSNATGNPVIWIEGGPSIPGKMREYNDDYATQGDYDWGVNARIKKKYSSTVYAVLLSTSSSYTPTSKCDLYMKCANSSIMNYFENLKSDDAIQSAPAANKYNCIAWSGGIYTDWCWPPTDLAEHKVSDDIDTFDYFYSSERYDGCSKFTREGATEENSVVDLWGIPLADGSIYYTHASVRNGADANIHGYDWESKPGSLMRTFHPRYSLNGNGYGKVVAHYRLVENATKTLDQAIAEGTATIEYADYSEEEKSIIESHINGIDDAAQEEFGKLYAQWKQIWNTTPFSNPAQIADCDVYRKLTKLCSSNSALIYKVFEKLGQGDICAVKLVKDLSVTKNKAVMESVMARNKNIAKASTGAKIIRPVHTNAMLYVKNILAKEISQADTEQFNQVAEDNISYSNSTDFAVTNSGNTLNVSFSVPEKTDITLKVLDLKGKEVYSLEQTSYSNQNGNDITIPIEEAGIYIVKLVINNKVNVKKISIK